MKVEAVTSNCTPQTPHFHSKLVGLVLHIHFDRTEAPKVRNDGLIDGPFEARHVHCPGHALHTVDEWSVTMEFVQTFS